jgi:hypothetical protein
MGSIHRFFIFAVISSAFVFTQLISAVQSGQAAAVDAQEVARIGVDAYIYGYPLVTMEMTRRMMTNVEKPKGTRAPMGQLVRMRTYPTAAFKDVTAPNADTLYTTGWMDVGREPWVLTIPDVKDRYYLMPMLDAWTEVFQAPGKRTTGTQAQKYLITGPGWKGKVPEGMNQYQSPTSLVWLLGRIYCTGTPEDYKAVHAIQDQVSIVPLSAYGKPYTPPPGKVDPEIDMHIAVRDQVHKLDAVAYFNLLTKLLKDNPPVTGDAAMAARMKQAGENNPPATADAPMAPSLKQVAKSSNPPVTVDEPMVARMKQIGIVPGMTFDISKLDPAVIHAIEDVPKAAQEKIMGHFKKAGVLENGWTFSTRTGIYGTDYLQRAFITAIGLGANRPQDAVYPTSESDADGKPYEGVNQYIMHFSEGQMPPVNAFWSLTMYNAHYFFVDNPLNRYTLGSRNNFTFNADGSVDLYIQADSPGPDKEANWLPAPKGRFVLMLRLYWPKETFPSIIDGTWKIPTVVKQVP